MASEHKTFITPEQYLAMERLADRKSEYFAGEVFAMAGASEQHITIVSNLTYLFVSQFKGRPCKTYSSEMKVLVAATGLFTYPDVVIVCAEPVFHDTKRDVLLNPQVLIEVLSDSTEAYDRGKKFEYYGSIDTITDYVLVSQDRPNVERFERQAAQGWHYTRLVGLGSVLEIEAIQCRLMLADVYDKVSPLAAV
jgi:Uma2 family endonuclease